MTRRHEDFQTIRSEGGLLPPDLLRRVLDPKDDGESHASKRLLRAVREAFPKLPMIAVEDSPMKIELQDGSDQRPPAEPDRPGATR